MRSERSAGRRLILLVLITLMCCEGFIYILYMPSMSSLLCNNEVPNQEEEKEQEQDEDQGTVILIWRWPFGHQMRASSCSKLFNITGCRLTDDRSEYEAADGVMFHHKDIHNNVTELLRMKRPPLQMWVWMNMESPGNSPRQARLDGMFNLTSSYRRDSDVWVPYGRIVQVSEQDRSFRIPKKDKLVCWIVNNWNMRFRRVRYFYELRKHVSVHTYGGAFKKRLTLEEYYKILPSCKFYLSFENSVYKDYFTEKLFNPMKVGTVPVVLGSNRQNYEEFIPAHSFIHTDDFKSPQELAKHLKFLDQNQEAYEQYFTWRQHFTTKSSYFGLEHACRICDHIQRHKGYRVVNNLSTWYWT
ncbi:4-galactosyl-N-acetylglucosaminide 3-alpha-L-fucosyltransferase 9-like [Silurus meridionalis]|uniref:4-galactosyl-N-acetylglucosaminide 3-alpha-L-fucosyltransferase 9-like n=1 Tax=Silurus meridionalis TaxID=175797 RepID=UPI001EEBF002|nr:4-galactosyl-N-acetylglucosaminide 3-alpha-L-fucosyltransferase 9-like [Silurus meridionalis]